MHIAAFTHAGIGNNLAGGTMRAQRVPVGGGSGRGDGSGTGPRDLRSDQT
jgi:hypothetical protein